MRDAAANPALTRLATLLGVAVLAGLATTSCQSDGQTCPGKSGLDLSNRNVTSADLAGRRLRCANLEGATLDNQNLAEMNLSRANLQGASLYKTRLGNVDCRRPTSAMRSSAPGRSIRSISMVPISAARR